MHRGKYYMASKSYSEKLKDPRWQKKRLQVFERDNWCCTNCGVKENSLHVHHRKYESYNEPWNEPLNNLATLCESCHKETHKNKKLMKSAILSINTYDHFSFYARAYLLAQFLTTKDDSKRGKLINTIRSIESDISMLLSLLKKEELVISMDKLSEYFDEKDSEIIIDSIKNDFDNVEVLDDWMD